MLKTSWDGKELMHRRLWEIVVTEAQLTKTLERRWDRPTVVAMMFAFHTVEAYLNFVGELLAPEIWRDERKYFRNEPYRGWDGKLRKVLELVGLMPEPGSRPMATILELRQLRDFIAHGKSETLIGEAVHEHDVMPPFPVTTLQAMIWSRELLAERLPDVEQFLDEIHIRAATGIDDVWFGERALRGPWVYSSGDTSIL